MEPIVERVEFSTKSDALRAAQIRGFHPADGERILLEGSLVELCKLGRDRGYVWCIV